MRHMKWFVPLLGLALVIGLIGAQAQAEEKPQAGKITGTVLDEEGNPAKNIAVRLMKPPPRPNDGPQEKKDRPEPEKQAAEGEKGPHDKGEGKHPGKGPGKGPGGDFKPPKPIAETTTNDEGEFSFDDVKPGRYGVLAGQRGAGMARQRIEVKPGETKTVELKLKKMQRPQQ